MIKKLFGSLDYLLYFSKIKLKNMVTNRSTKRLLKKQIFNNIKSLKKTVNTIAKKWDKKTIPLTTLKLLIDKIKVSSYDRQDKELANLFESYNNVIESLYDACDKTSKSMNSNEIPVEYFNNCIHVIHENFNTGLKGNE